MKVDINCLLRKIESGEVPSTIGFEMGTLPVIECDESRFEQLVENLLRNAVEHRKPSLVEVLLDEETNNLQPMFRNDEIPIKDNLRTHLFKSEESIDIQQGLGLFIVKKIVEAHG